MLYYRYRCGNELSLKELIYDEMFFSSTSECNDPCEGLFIAKFDKNFKHWENFIKLNLDKTIELQHSNLIKTLAEYLTQKSPMTVDEFVSMPFNDIVNHLGNQNRLILEILYAKMIRFIENYSPVEQYFVSFSKSNDNFLMWSHYANKHQGYCLVFNVTNNKIRQHKKMFKSTFKTNSTLFNAPMTFNIPYEFDLYPIEYSPSREPINAFMCLPEIIVGDDYTKEEKDKFIENFNKIYLIKNSVWAYEEEVRICIDGGIPWLAGQQIRLSSNQRLLHYDPKHLIGIILGTRMPLNQKNRIREIIAEKIRKISTDNALEKSHLSDFVIFEEKISPFDQRIFVEPIELIDSQSMSTWTGITDNFQEKYATWKTNSLKE